jgi:hypothetical protein
MNRRQAFKLTGLIVAYAAISWAQTPKPAGPQTPEQIRAQQFHQRVELDKKKFQPGQKAKPLAAEDLRAYQAKWDKLGADLRASHLRLTAAQAKFTPPKGR